MPCNLPRDNTPGSHVTGALTRNTDIASGRATPQAIRTLA
jgi:hypothetical protein